MGTLKVLIQKKGEKDKVVWKKSGNQGNLWFKADVSIKSAKPYRVRHFQLYSSFSIRPYPTKVIERQRDEVTVGVRVRANERNFE